MRENACAKRERGTLMLELEQGRVEVYEKDMLPINTQNPKVFGIRYGCTHERANWNPINAINRLTCRVHVLRDSTGGKADGQFRYLTAANHRRCVGVYLRLYFMFSPAPCRMQTIASRRS